MKIKREAASKIEEALLKFPIVSVMGPRQSGKTTLCKMLKPASRYVNLEEPSARDFAKTLHPVFFNLVLFDKPHQNTHRYLVYGGSEHQKRKEATVLGFHQLDFIWEHSPILPLLP